MLKKIYITQVESEEEYITCYETRDYIVFYI